MKKFPHYRQLDHMDCGPTCLKMIAKHHGKSFSLPFLRENSHIDRQGVSLLGLSGAAERIGFRTMGVKIPFKVLAEEAPLPVVVHWRQNHFVVVYKIAKGKVYVSDPAADLLVYSEEEFLKSWAFDRSADEPEGVCLILEPSPEFHENEEGLADEKPVGFRFLLPYLRPYSKLLWQLFFGLLAGSLLTLFAPLLTQALVDTGVAKQNMDFIYLILAAQLALFSGKIMIKTLRSWILMHISARLNISVLSDFLIKLTARPIAFFESKNLGDILQRIRDHKRLEHFLTSGAIEFLFSLVTVFVFGIVLFIYNANIFLIFLFGTALHFTWVNFFMKRRRTLDHRKFAQSSVNQNNEVQLVQGMQEIKLQNAEQQKRWEWEQIQVKLFKLSIKGLELQEFQNVGAAFINELKNIIITFWAAKETVEGRMTLGMMLAVQHILGMMAAPLFQFVEFMRQAQDARISLERLSEIHGVKNTNNEIILHEIPDSADITLKDLCFRYGDPNADYVLNNLNLVIPHGKTTAIVGESGSGKTTLLKLLLKFYEPESGEITVGKTPLRHLSAEAWRRRTGAVMQDGYIFSDTIAGNVAAGEEFIDRKKVCKALEIACLDQFVEELPLNYKTKIGASGLSFSQGQKQRILIARAVYKQPDCLLFDEATSALDTRNEKKITDNLRQFNEKRTVLVIAHRLSTVRDADQIIVLNKGKIDEQGTHEELVAQKGRYYELIKNQLELSA